MHICTSETAVWCGYIIWACCHLYTYLSDFITATVQAITSQKSRLHFAHNSRKYESKILLRAEYSYLNSKEDELRWALLFSVFYSIKGVKIILQVIRNFNILHLLYCSRSLVYRVLNGWHLQQSFWESKSQCLAFVSADRSFTFLSW